MIDTIILNITTTPMVIWLRPVLNIGPRFNVASAIRYRRLLREGRVFCHLNQYGREKALEIAERVRRNVADTRFPNESAQPNKDLTVSLGVATFSSPISNLTDLIREADQALYRAKKKGRNRIEG
jgi:GGDEF domain-containing protein